MTQNNRRLLPPIGALASFEAAARQGNFSRAGEGLGLTQSAISRQIALLEDWLELRLFTRAGRRVTLSADGEIYLKAITPALDRIRSATAAAISRHSDRELNITTLPSFGMRWLGPRLPQLHAHNPEIVINFAARSFPFSFAEENFDAAIHFGLADWPNATHDLLFREEVIPVCAPSRLAQSPIKRPEDVLAWPLLVQLSRRDAWVQWLEVAGVDQLCPAPSASFEHFLMLAQAAAAGAGIALIPRFLVEPELAEGKLVCPLEISLASENAYYLVLPMGRPRSPILEQFRSWLLEQARRS